METNLSRRDWFKRSAALGISVLFHVDGSVADQHSSATSFEPNARLSIDPDGKITVLIEKAEMGQGVTVALAQIVAEELEADWRDVDFVLSTYTSEQGFVFTASSLSIYTAFDTVSRAAASARLMLVSAAAQHWRIGENQCRAANSAVVADGRRLSYAEIVRLQPRVRIFSPQELDAIALKRPDEYTVVGRSLPSPRHAEKARGALDYGIDQHLPNMVYAKVAYPPARGGRQLKVNDRRSREVSGFVQTVNDEHVLAVVASSYSAAEAARDALEVEWDEGAAVAVNSAEIAERFKQRIDSENGRPWVQLGDAQAAISAAKERVSQYYSTDLVAHLQMEPYNALAEFRNGEMHLYCGTQYPTRLVEQVAAWCELPREKIFVHCQYMGGGFGALLETEWHAQAAVIAREVGRPVKLILSREEDTANDCFRSPTYQKLTCGLDADKQLSGWEHRVVSAWPSTRHSIFLDKDGFDSYALSGADHHYDISDQHARAIEDDLGVPVGYVRGVACGYMFFAVESFMDEVAHQAGRDPLDWRLALLKKQPRLAHVLKRAAVLGGWGQPQVADSGLGLAVITAQDSHHNTTRIGACAAASVEPESGKISVHKISCVVDCGVVINPNGARQMAEGALLYGLGIALKGGGSLEGGRIVEQNFDTYPVLTMSEVPELEIELVDSTAPATGMGEPTMGCIAPALANAVFAACGARVRQLPMTPERVKSAMAS